MIRYFEVKKDTKEYVAAEKSFTWRDAWQTDEILTKLREAIGIDPIKNMQMNPYVLRLLNLPDGVRDQFKKNRTNTNHYEAFAKSDINKRYLDIVKNYNLTVYSMIEFTLMFGWDNCIGGLHFITSAEKNRRFFIELKEGVVGKDLLKYQTHPALTEIKEYDYLILRADMLKNLEGEQK